MNRKKHFLLILVAIVLSFTLAFSLFACNRDTGKDDKEEENTSAINGTFASVESETYPMVPTSWTASAGSSSGSLATPAQQDKDLLSGVINVDKKIFSDNAKKWKLAKDMNPFKPNNDSKDNNVLMINNLVETSYKYTSAAVNIEKNSYYKITFNVLTQGDAKAFMSVINGAYAEFKSVQANGWTPYTVIIEGATNTTNAINLILSNGYGDKVNGVMSKGAVFFDDITAEKLEKEGDANYGKNIYDTAVSAPAKNTLTYSMKTPDTDFDYTSGSTNPLSPAKYRGQAGKDSTGNAAPTGSSYLNYGVVDTNLSIESLGLGEKLDLAPNAKGSKMLFINNKKSTAYSYRSTVPFVIESGKIYQFSIALKTQDIPSGKGATLKLVENGSDKETTNEIKNINNNSWVTYTMEITGSQLATKEVYFELWLGEGGKGSDKWTTGTVFADLVSLKEIPAKSENADSATFKNVDYSEIIDNTTNEIDFGYIMDNSTSNGWLEINADPSIRKNEGYNFNNNGKASHLVVENTEGTPVPLPGNNLTIKTDTDPVILKDALKISITDKTAYGIVIKDGANMLDINKNSYYKVSMWVKTDLDEKYDAQGLNIKLMQVVEGEDEKNKEIAAFTNINTRKIDTNANNYVEISFYVEGSATENDKLYLEVMLGSGTRFTPDTHVTGDAYITLVGMTNISHDDYVKASTSTYSKKSSLSTGSSSSPSIANGNFSDTDINATYDNYLNYQGKGDHTVDEFIDTDEVSATFNDFKRPTAPTSWTISNKSYLEALDTGIISGDTTKGTLQFNNLTANAKSSLGNSYGAYIDGAYKETLLISTKKPIGGGGVLTNPTSPETCGCTCPECIEAGICDGTKCKDDPNCKCLHKAQAELNVNGGVLPVGYTSSSISLNANSYYRISVQVKVGQDSDSAYVILSNNQDKYAVEVKSTNGGWKDVVFYINTGLSSTSVKLDLYLGNKGGKEVVQGAVAFDNASFLTIDKDIYNNAEATENSIMEKVAFIVDSFNIENPSDETLTAPNNWSGAVATNGSSEADSILKGVYDKDYSRDNWLKTTDKDGNTTEINADVMKYLTEQNVDAHGNNFLVINNIVPNGYSFTNSSDSKTLAKDAYYAISVDVFTYGLKSTDTAYISLKLNNMTYTFDKDDEHGVLVNTSTYEGDKETMGEWTNYQFYVKTPENTAVSNVTITLGLGKASNDEKAKDKNFVQGYAFFDNVKFIESDKATFNAKADGKLTKVISATDEDMLKPPAKEDEDKEEEKPQNNLLWVYITSGVIGGLIIIVVIGVVLKKYWSRIVALFNKNKAKNTADYDKNNALPKSDNDNKKNKKKNNSEFKD